MGVKHTHMGSLSQNQSGRFVEPHAVVFVIQLSGSLGGYETQHLLLFYSPKGLISISDGIESTTIHHTRHTALSHHPRRCIKLLPKYTLCFVVILEAGQPNSREGKRLAIDARKYHDFPWE